MPAPEITSAANPRLKEYCRLAESRRFRRAAGKLALEGPHLVREALAAGLLPEAVFYTRGYRESAGGDWLAALPESARQFLLPPALFARISRTEHPQAVAAIVSFDEAEAGLLPAGDLSLVLILDRLQDPGNMGTILRTALAAGVDAVFYTAGCVDPYSPKVLRSTAGAVFHLRPAAAGDPPGLLEKLKSRGVCVVAAQPGAPLHYWEVDLRKPAALLIGNEGAGIAEALAAAADHLVSIPQAGKVDSLNAAVAASVILFEALRQRSAGSGAPG